MWEVNIYIMHTVRGVHPRDGKGIYILETKVEDKEYTITRRYKLQGMREKQAELDLTIRALKELKKPCVVTIHTDLNYVAQGLTEWIENWKAKDWKTSKGKEVSYREQWKDLDALREEHEIAFRVGYMHSYHSWMETDIRKGNDYV